MNRHARLPAGGLAVAGLIGASWYLAEKVRSEALTVAPGPAWPACDDVRFVGLSPGQAQLVAVGRQPDLAKAGLRGIAWPGGTGYLASPVTAAGGVVTRPLTVTSGSAPRAGQCAALAKTYFLTGASLGLPVAEVAVPGPLGPLPAWHYPGRGETFVIGVHGQNGTRADVLRIIDIAARMGFPALAVTYRGDLGVAPDPSGYFRYGQTEWRDLEAAVRWALAHGARRVVLAGQSMGAGIVAAFLRHSPLAATVARVVFDAPMLDLHAAAEYQVRRQTSPLIGRALAPLVALAERIASVRFGVDWSAVAYLDETAWLTVPALVTHGDDDTRVPASISATLKERQPSLVDLAVFPGAGHLESWNTDRARYTSLLESFLTPVRPLPARRPGPAAGPRAHCRAEAGEPQLRQLLRPGSPAPRPRDRDVMITALWALDDFTAANGATRVVPGSHRRLAGKPSSGEAVPVEMPAGSVLLFAGRLYHGAGANRTGRPRLGVVLEYAAPWLRPVEAHTLSVDPAEVRRLPQRLQELLGFNQASPYLGFVNGRHPREWLTRETTV